MDAPKTSLFLGLPSDYMLEYYNTIQQQQQLQLQQHNNKFINVNINDNSSINSNTNSNITYNNNNNNNNNNSSNSVCNSISLEYEENDVDNINDVDSNQCIRMSDHDEHDENQQQYYTNNCSNDVITIDGVANDTSTLFNSDIIIDEFHNDDYDNNVSRIEVEMLPTAAAYQCEASTLYDDSEEMTSVSGSSTNNNNNNNNNNKKVNNNPFSWHNEEELAYLDSWRNLGFISAGASMRRFMGLTTTTTTTTTTKTVDSSSSLSSVPTTTTATRKTLKTTNQPKLNNCCSSSDSTNTSATRDYQSSPVFTVDDYNKIQQKQHEHQLNKYQCSLSNYPKQIK